jgi:DHA1 family bicyclomycin/chloramphenicol resistance-like MFS transporter
MADRGTHCGIAAAVTGFISTIMAVPISIFIGRFIADRLPLFVAFRYVQHYQSDYLFI